MQATLPSAAEVQAQCAALPGEGVSPLRPLTFTDWDSTLLPFLLKLKEICEQHQIAFDQTSLPQGAQRLLALAYGSARAPGRPP